MTQVEACMATYIMVYCKQSQLQTMADKLGRLLTDGMHGG